MKKILKELKDQSHDSLFVVQYRAGTLHKIPVIFSQLNSQHKSIKLSVSPIFLQQLENSLTGSQHVSIYLERMECLFKSQILSFDIGKRVLTISFPKSYALSDRRERTRILTGNSVVQFLYHHDQPYVVTKKHIYDLSLGGCSLVFSASEYVRIKQGDELKHLAITYAGQTHYFDGVVVAVKRLKPFELEQLPYAQHRMSIAFINMDDMQKIFLTKILDNLTSLQKKKSS